MSYSPIHNAYTQKPLANFYVTAVEGYYPYTSYTAITDSAGNYTITGLTTCTDYVVQPDAYQSFTGSFTSSNPSYYVINTGYFIYSVDFVITF